MSNPENDDEQPVGEVHLRPRRGKAARSPDDGRPEAGALRKRRTSKRERSRPDTKSSSSDPSPDGPARDGEYLVGYGKPPESSRFKKGQSGNPRGRKSDLRNLRTLLAEELDRKVIVTENGRRRSRSMRRITTRQVVTRAASGDLKATAIVFDLWQQTEDETAEVRSFDLTGDDQAVLDALLARLQRREAGGDD